MQLALTLVFVETKKGADALENWLCRSGFPAIAIHGDKVQMVSSVCSFALFLPYSLLCIQCMSCACLVVLATVAVTYSLFGMMFVVPYAFKSNTLIIQSKTLS